MQLKQKCGSEASQGGKLCQKESVLPRVLCNLCMEREYDGSCRLQNARGEAPADAGRVRAEDFPPLAAELAAWRTAAESAS